VNPLDLFEYASDSSGFTLTYQDLSLKYGLASTASSVVSLDYRSNALIKDRPVADQRIHLSPSDLALLAEAHRPGDDPEDNLFRVTISSKRDGSKDSQSVSLWLWRHAESGELQLVGIRH
jgi:hypothetical protein